MLNANAQPSKTKKRKILEKRMGNNLKVITSYPLKQFTIKFIIYYANIYGLTLPDRHFREKATYLPASES
ncbi:hypothetical protein RCL_jg17685.t1 [Rhizophagus clarus]|uniref:Uncharacterized protein n=1 Tax=Rhizophagus clarus TaxID=94130 RepID=A0A8H3QLE2_9GLOM|nr:hypothetical protein RCL_jg17685.t1 [Rhizophagus clarus]